MWSIILWTQYAGKKYIIRTDELIPLCPFSAVVSISARFFSDSLLMPWWSQPVCVDLHLNVIGSDAGIKTAYIMLYTITVSKIWHSVGPPYIQISPSGSLHLSTSMPFARVVDNYCIQYGWPGSLHQLVRFCHQPALHDSISSQSVGYRMLNHYYIGFT